jgi:hydroxyacylglutathione hydrolase
MGSGGVARRAIVPFLSKTLTQPLQYPCKAFVKAPYTLQEEVKRSVFFTQKHAPFLKGEIAVLLKYFYDKPLAHASYMVGCQKTGEAIIVDPARDISGYLETAKAEGMRIVGIAETHIHADYVSGARELAERAGATLYVSDEGDENWKYEYAAQYPAMLLKDGDHFKVGNIGFDVMHTPGHTPESISLLVTDMGGGATTPMGIFTGDFVFVGSIGRPDLLEKAVGLVDNAKVGAKQMYASWQRFKQLPDYLQVWPAHGAGSACGKGLGAIPSSTVGYEKLFNPALRYTNESAFVDYLLADQPEVPPYFAVMKKVNKEGPAITRNLKQIPTIPADTLNILIEDKALVIDVRNTTDFARGHLPGTVNIPVTSLAQWAGWFVNYSKPVYLIASTTHAAEAARVLHAIGVDNIRGYTNSHTVQTAGLNTEQYEVATPQSLVTQILNGDVTLVDVRAASEWQEGHLPNARHIMLGQLPQRANEIINGKPIVLQCRTGARSAIAASLLQAAGAKNVINMAGGYRDWQAAGLPVES